MKGEASVLTVMVQFELSVCYCMMGKKMQDAALRQESVHVEFMPEVFRIELCLKHRISIMHLGSSAQSQEGIAVLLQTSFPIRPI